MDIHSIVFCPPQNLGKNSVGYPPVSSFAQLDLEVQAGTNLDLPLSQRPRARGRTSRNRELRIKRERWRRRGSCD